MLHGERVEGAIDTPENRFVLYTLKELARRLNRFADDQEKVKLVNPDWIKGVRQMASELVRLSRNPFFSGVGLFAGFRQQSLVMQKQAGYAQVFTVWNKLKRALKPGGDDVDVSYRPISMLYEFWCFLKMREMLDELLGVDGKVEMGSATEADLLETPELDDESKVDENKLSKESVVYEKDGVIYTLTYQKTYVVRDIDGLENEAFSSLNPQRPDIVLTIAADGNMYSYLFDAKYRIWSMPGQGQQVSEGGARADADATTRDAMDAMYRYRDAILYRLQKSGIKREIVGAYVLYPGRKCPHLYKPYQKTIKHEGIGAIPLLPGFEEELKKRIHSIIKKHSPADRLATATSVRGTSVVVGEAYGESLVLDVKEQPSESFLANVRRGFIYPVEKRLVDSDRSYRQIKYSIPNQSVGMFNIDKSVEVRFLKGRDIPNFALLSDVEYCVYTLEATTVSVAGITPRPLV